MRPDLRGDKDALRDERLAFINGLLGLRRPVESLTSLSDGQLGKVLEEMKRIQGGENTAGARSREPEAGATAMRSVPPAVAGGFPRRVPAAVSEPEAVATGSAEVVHLATAEQVFTIGKLFDFMAWEKPKIEGFLFKRYRRRSERMLTPKQAGSLIMILFSIGAQSVLKQRSPGEKFSRPQIAEEIPHLKARLGIDQWKGAN